ncbi:MAG TPA: DUF427 domain-containing protein [Candidatus Saccharimonadales bacterium]|nr:DUF427 domain-containing protein [Candidatus Saccharimonadales bacterium]
MTKAIWNGHVLAESDQTIRIEGNHYFPPDSINRELFTPSDTHTTCPWKGEASYYNVVVDGEINDDAAWYYPEPKDGATKRVGQDFANYVAFWRGVEVA